VRPIIRPGLTVAWRTADTLQLGIDDPQPVVISGVPASAKAVLGQMDGVRTRSELLTTVAQPEEIDEIASLVDQLIELGAVVDAGRWPGGPRISAKSRARLLPELMAASPSEPERWWKSLAQTQVSIIGASRLGASIACSLAAAGIGRIAVDDRRPVAMADVSPGGFTPDDVGKPRSTLLALHPEWRAMSSRLPLRQEITVITDAVDVDDHAHRLATEGMAHLVVSCRERIGRVGPLVKPGITPCVVCLHLRRRDHDPLWPDVWRQQPPTPSPVAHVTTVAITAQLAASHVLTWALGEEPLSSHSIVEIRAPHGTMVTRPSHRHPECGCAWATMTG
jgi:hypothetical protein